MMKEEILTEWNPWWAKEFLLEVVEREILGVVTPWLKRREILTFLGARRAGKTTLMYLLIYRLLKRTDPRNILFIKCDDERVEKKDMISDAIETYYRLMNPEKKPFFLFIDEVQEINGWQRTLKRLYDLNSNIKIFISGSNALLLREELSTLLSGRFAYFSVYPFSFVEFLHAKGMNFKTRIEALAEKSRIQHLLKEYLEWGGFPEIVLEKNKKLKQELLKFYHDSILYRDVSKRYNIKNTAKLDRLASYFLSNVSNLANFTKIGKQIGLSTDTVVDYCKFFEEAYFLFSMPIFSYSIKAQQINPKKIYCVDTGLRNAVGFRFSEDIGRIAENAVFVHLKRTGKNVFYWRNDKGQEIDFIVKEKFKPSVAIQVCWNFTEDVKERELESLIAGMQKLKLSTGYVLTEDFEAEERVGRKKIIFIPLWKWFLEISRQATSG